MNYYTLFEAGTFTKGYPWVQMIDVSDTPDEIRRCPTCRRHLGMCRRGRIEGKLAPRKGTKWPDDLGCSTPFLIVSEAVVRAWMELGVSPLPIHEFAVVGDLPERLRDIPMPRYYWIDGTVLPRARIDAPASGYPLIERCAECEWIDVNPSSITHRMRKKVPLVLLPGEWESHDLFVAEISSMSYLCSQRIVDCAAEHGFTNFGFVPLDRASSLSSPYGDPIRYRKPKRRSVSPGQPSL